MEIYVVQPGDTLYRIAQRYGTTVAALQSVNQLPNPDRLVIGQAILIPSPPLEPLRYTVQPGDTLYQLALLFNTTVSQIAQANQIINPNQIAVGTTLLIPGWSQFNYQVQPGDTLSLIAGRYGIAVAMIAKVNQIANPALIYPGQILRIPQITPTKPNIEVLAYIMASDISGMEQSLPQIGSLLTYGVVFQFPVDATGAITVPDNTARAVSVLKQYNVQPSPAVTNWGANGFDSDLARSIIGNDTVKTRTINNILTILNQFGFAGVNIDFENMYPDDRTLFNNFIRDLVAALKPQGYSVSVAVPAKFSDQPSAAWVGTFDYATLGQLADFIFLMTYEWGWIGGPPMAIAPINLVRRALTYATSLIPPAKILQGIPLYGYNWPIPQSPDRPAVPVNLVEVYDLALRYGVNINYDSQSQAPWFRYTDEQGQQHEVWFEDARSITAKYTATRDFNLRGVGYWSYWGNPYGFPQNWVILNDMFRVVKIPAGS